MKKTILAAFAVASALSGCAEYPNNISTAYIPSIVYKGASCGELVGEKARLERHVADVAAAQQNTANWDTALVASGTLIFWPALLALPMTRDQQAQLSVARGHYEALILAGRNQGCGDAFYQKRANQVEERGYGYFPPL
ncbi:hypothetical protein [Cognatishimia activa]|uniref:Lipoprotein n=1 Tax=Cognatishimia activa TaxID=1715691 RepID=A0A0N7MC46_9RHOB|nr:hypothetical protein [Cognatishimia activa]CUJ31128.1 hypothetical protein TA5113_02988 [Cognatishimia activa]CUK27192.1 hypothetical protein TA5114_03015 [Cognatishimia activa]